MQALFDLFKESFSIIQPALSFIFDFYYLWLPIILARVFWEYWKKYVIALALSKEEMTLLQIRLPREISKSPKAMELFMQNLYQTGGEGDFYKKYWKGGSRPWFSLEIVSVEGEVRFYIYARVKMANMLESQLYSQYPTIEVVNPADDYTKKVKYDPETKDLYGARFTLVKDDAYPIKTYVDFGLDADPKEEFKVDPIAAVIESLGTLGLGEQIWIQILVRAHKKKEEGGFLKWLLSLLPSAFGGSKNLIEQGKALVEKLKEEGLPNDPEALEKKTARKTKQQERVIEAIERSIAKQAFDTIVRAVYIADKDKYDKAKHGVVQGSFTQYNSDGLNGFKPTDKTEFDFPWQDIWGNRLKKKKLEFFDDYIRRAHYLDSFRFHLRYNVDNFILTTEELATVFHFPSSSVMTPTLPRIPSKKAEPPRNLPF